MTNLTWQACRVVSEESGHFFCLQIVGALVMPCAAMLAARGGRWAFGRLACDLWHALDVCSCTASILNLSCIALERFVATTDPIRHPVLLSRPRVASLIGILWLCSAAISFPAIIWWRHIDAVNFAAALDLWRSQANDSDARESSTSTQNASPSRLPILRQPPRDPLAADTEQCEFPEDGLYLLCSSVVSFYLPCAVMFYFYFSIYRVCRCGAARRDAAPGARFSSLSI